MKHYSEKLYEILRKRRSDGLIRVTAGKRTHIKSIRDQYMKLIEDSEKFKAPRIIWREAGQKSMEQVLVEYEAPKNLPDNLFLEFRPQFQYFGDKFKIEGVHIMKYSDDTKVVFQSPYFTKELDDYLSKVHKPHRFRGYAFFIYFTKKRTSLERHILYFMDGVFWYVDLRTQELKILNYNKYKTVTDVMEGAITPQEFKKRVIKRQKEGDADEGIMTDTILHAVYTYFVQKSIPITKPTNAHIKSATITEGVGTELNECSYCGMLQPSSFEEGKACLYTGHKLVVKPHKLILLLKKELKKSK